MGNNKLQLCPHTNTLGKTKCKKCQKINRNRFELKNGIKVGIGSGNYKHKLQLCKHGVLGTKNCPKCHSEWDKKNYKKSSRYKGIGHGGAKLQLCPHGVLGKRKCNLCIKDYQKLCRLKKGIKPHPKCPHGEKTKHSCKLCNDEYRRKRGQNVGIGTGNRKVCIHNISPKKNCIICRRNYGKEQAKKHPYLKRKSESKRRRNLGWDEINNCFKNSNGHHIDNETVIYIPEWLHKSLIPHSPKTGQNMQLVNDCIFQYLECTNQVEWITTKK